MYIPEYNWDMLVPDGAKFEYYLNQDKTTGCVYTISRNNKSNRTDCWKATWIAANGAITTVDDLKSSTLHDAFQRGSTINGMNLKELWEQYYLQTEIKDFDEHKWEDLL